MKTLETDLLAEIATRRGRFTSKTLQINVMVNQLERLRTAVGPYRASDQEERWMHSLTLRIVKSNQTKALVALKAIEAAGERAACSTHC